jgi:hypothetical protein
MTGVPPSDQATGADDPLTDFVTANYTFDGVTKRVVVSGASPAVVVMAEMPGISPHVARFSRWVRDVGFSVYLPSLFGMNGAFPEAESGAEVLRRAYVSARRRKEWEAGAAQRDRTFLQEQARRQCLCRHDRREHENGDGRCSGSLPHAAAINRIPCICLGFESQPNVPPEWRLTS